VRGQDENCRRRVAGWDSFAWLTLAISIGAGNITPVFLLIAPTAVLILLRRRLNPLLLSPVKGAISILTLIGLLGFIVYGKDLEQEHQATVFLRLQPQDVGPTVRLIALSALFIAVGSALSKKRESFGARGAQINQIGIGSQTRTILLAGCVVPLLISLIDYRSLLYRPTYLQNNSGSVVAIAGGQLSIAAIAALGYLYPAERGARRLLCVVTALLHSGIFFALGSRRFALIPLIFALGAYAATLDKRGNRRVLLAAVVSLLLVPIPLYLRGLSDHGLLPYVQALPEYLSSDVGLSDTVENLLLPFPVISVTAFQEPMIGLDNLLVELNPLPGTISGWYEISESMRINSFVPYSAIGEIGQQNLTFFATFWIFIGALLGYLEERVQTLLTDGRRAVALALLSLTLFFSLLVTEYNVRAAMRMLIYAIAIDLAIRWSGSQPVTKNGVDRAEGVPATQPHRPVQVKVTDGLRLGGEPAPWR